MKQENVNTLEGFTKALVDFTSKFELKIPPYEVKNIIYDFPYALVNWKDGTITIVKCMKGDTFSRSVGFSMALAKKLFGKKKFKEMIEKAYVQKPTE